ncbi:MULTISPECIES: hypothetical protein [unclassified Streptomyces]|uniref:hypothetical protein n=1 Tax=unclassified Streptomyces TaxID=2593676 RepID=UPI00093CD317|nr:hypothetical protein [Streptomyces sp. CB01883]OKJ73347.1 hypothetical protein AMK32_37015 [Streptomyces sp. CB01883]
MPVPQHPAARAMNVDDVVAEKIAAARARAEAAKRRRAAFTAARQRGLAARHAQKLARLAETESPTSTIARRHGHTGPTVCQDCGTTEGLHFGSWADPSTGESGDFLQCCACGIRAGDPAYVHANCAPTNVPKEIN